MPRRRLNRREALGLGAAALAAAAVRPAPALAAHTALFELDLPAGGDAAAASWRTLPVLRAPRRFDLVGLRWERGGHVEAEVRARRAGGSWTPWTPVPTAGDHAPDGRRAPAGTEPAWTGPADLLQVRMRGHARGLRARFVRAQPTARTARAAAARLRRRAGARSAQIGGLPRIIPRAEWGAAAVPPREAPSYGQVQVAFVHHTVTANDYGPEDSAGIVLGIARFHRDANRWNDVGYNFLVDKYGQVFEGRAGGIDRAVIGAQAQGFNAVSTGIACLGDHSVIAQSEPALEALARLIGWKLPLHGVPVEGAVTVASAGGSTSRYATGALVTLQRISGHRDGNKTSCPGEGLYGQLADLRRRAARRADPIASASVSLRVAPKVRGLEPLPVAGALLFADGSPRGGAPVQVEHRRGDGPWSVLAETRTQADGSWLVTPVVPRTGELRAVFPGDGLYPRAESAATRVQVLAELEIDVHARRLPRGKRFRVRGTVSPAPRRVTWTLERRSRGRWLRERRRRTSVRDGAYYLRLRPRRAGLYRVRVSAPGARRRRLVRVLSASASGGTPAG